MKITENYMEKVYAGWLGKIVGIRLGAPIEGWTYQRIRDVFGEVWSYPVDYKNFAADDDSNGPLFFIRALEDCEDLNNFSSKDVANALLNYAPYEHGFFWWGGYGVSTEHTAYLNLRNGIPAPRSGSIEQNGATMAEQIGGQILLIHGDLFLRGIRNRQQNLPSRQPALHMAETVCMAEYMLRAASVWLLRKRVFVIFLRRRFSTFLMIVNMPCS